jgi:hypothetical protein
MVESGGLLIAYFAAEVIHRYLEDPAFSFEMRILNMAIKLPFSFEGLLAFITLVALWLVYF